MSDIFDVLADDDRRAILFLLLDAQMNGNAELSVSDLVAKTGLTQPTVSKQLKVLREAGVAGVREDGQHRRYHLEPGPLGEAASWLSYFAPQGEASVGAAASAAGAQRASAPLDDEVLEVAASLGRAAANVTHQVTSVIDEAQASARNFIEQIVAKLGK